MSTLKTSDFLTPQVSKNLKKVGVKRKTNDKAHETNKKSKKDTTWRGTMSIQLKSANSIKEDAKKEKVEKEKKPKSNVVNESLSTTVGTEDNLLFFDATLWPFLLTTEEVRSLKDRIAKFEKKYNDSPSVLKLSWKDRDGATLLGMSVNSSVTVESNGTEAQQCKVGKNSEVWLATGLSLEKIAVDNIKGEKFTCAVPKFKGLVRLTINGVGSGANGLQIR